MVWRRLLLATLVALTPQLVATVTNAPCTSDRQLAGLCDVALSADLGERELTLDALLQEFQSEPPGGGQRADESAGAGAAPEQAAVAPTLDVCSPTNPTDCTFTGAEPEPPPAGEPAVTLRDIALFRPAAPSNGMEPDGWGVVGLPTNFVAEASVQTLSGTLLGRSADVRFHPVAYRWTHSDGAVVQSSVPGSTWEELAQAEFTATETSHIYATSGEHMAELAVVYVAEYRFDGSAWRWIDGTLTVAGEPRTVLVGEFDTVLVTGDCTVAPDGPGC